MGLLGYLEEVFGVPGGGLRGTVMVSLGYLEESLEVPSGVPGEDLRGTLRVLHGVPGRNLWVTSRRPFGDLEVAFGVPLGYVMGTWRSPLRFLLGYLEIRLG